MPNTSSSPKKIDHLKEIEASYDVIVIGSGLGGMTAANRMARAGRKVLLLEHHYNLGGLATYFKRKGGHIFDVSLHGFPYGMIKSCRKYWSKEIASNIKQVKEIVFRNPQFELSTSFDEQDFTRHLVETFGIQRSKVDGFFEHVRKMEFTDQDQITTRELFQTYFPDRPDVWRLLMEPITYANGSSLDEPAISYGIVFSNFMSKGVYIYRGGTDDLIRKMRRIMIDNGVTIRTKCLVEQVLTDDEGRVRGVRVGDREIVARVVISNAGLKNTIEKLLKPEQVPAGLLDDSRKVRLNSSSCQVYMGLKPGESIPHMGELIFTSSFPCYDHEALTSTNITSRTYSVYYPDIRPQTEGTTKERYAVVSSTNSLWKDWANLSDEEYEQEKQKLIDSTLVAVDRHIPGLAGKLEHIEAATPRTFRYYTRHMGGSSFGTKFEGLKVSMDLPKQIPGLFHAGSVGIIMSGWLGALNYGVIVANDADRFLNTQA
jgi:phytoene dehydrogenase-like protein